jgi:serine O-acetyltransferase
MTLFLYLLSRAEAQVGRIESADRISYLNKIRNGVDIWHTVSLPSKTVFVHPTGTVLGRAKYGTSLICYQNVTVGGSKGNYPKFHGSCLLYSNVSVLGNCNIGTNVVIGAGTLLVDKDIPDSSTVFGRGRDLVIRPNPKDLDREFFKAQI